MSSIARDKYQRFALGEPLEGPPISDEPNNDDDSYSEGESDSETADPNFTSEPLYNFDFNTNGTDTAMITSE